ncbi:MAG TPA: DUF1217 domain-containing protein [Roseiarcus sp.]|nr:DUF1217 domain-containing protein [Roseiarcus sp.]
MSYALDAYGLGDQVNNTALIREVLEGGVSNPKSLANTLTDSRWKAFAAAFDFVGKGASSVSSATAVQATTSNYVEQQLESDQGAQDVGVQLALYFQRVAPTVSNEYGILADQNLFEVAPTIFGLSPGTSATDIDAQAHALSQLMPLSDLQDPKKLQQLTERFTAMYDLTYGPASGATTSLSVSSDNSSSSASAASAILAGVIDPNGQAIGTGAHSFHQCSDPHVFRRADVEPAEVRARRLGQRRQRRTRSRKSCPMPCPPGLSRVRGLAGESVSRIR